MHSNQVREMRNTGVSVLDPPWKFAWCTQATTSFVTKRLLGTLNEMTAHMVPDIEYMLLTCSSLTLPTLSLSTFKILPTATA
jgi:hypothetical protein